MDDVASAKNENANLRKMQQKLLQWEITDKPLAPLTSRQHDGLESLIQLCGRDDDATTVPSPSVNHELPPPKDELTDLKSITNEHDILFYDSNNTTAAIPIESTQSFLNYQSQINLDEFHYSNTIYKQYYGELLSRSVECENVLKQIDSTIGALAGLQIEYDFVSNKTSSLNSASEKLIAEQKQLNEIGDEIKRRLHYFTQVEQFVQLLRSPTLSVSSEMFYQTLNKIDECLYYLNTNPNFKDSASYILRYRQCLGKAIVLIRQYLNQIFVNATEQVLASRQNSNNNNNNKIDNKSNATTTAAVSSSQSSSSSSDAAFAIYYGKFQQTAPKAKRIIMMVEERIQRSPEYEQILTEILQTFLSHRAQIMSPGVEAAIKDLASKNKGDNCALVRSSCAFIVHVCQDENRLFYQFFANSSGQFFAYLEGLCTILYDILRPQIIHINHLETLADICSILRVEMIDEYVQHNPESLESFGRIANQLLQDVQERLVFRAYIYLQSDILNYKPSPGDLAYPEKLEMMESIAMSLQQTAALKRTDSRMSIISIGSVTSQEVDSITTSMAANDEQLLRARITGNSPADLHGMWYPTVRRTLVCLSRLYRCVDRPIFQGLSQEALTSCVQSVSRAAQQISTEKTSIDGKLFEIKHLLILREQIAPFRVDFTMRETSLDFSKVKTAAYGLLQKRKQLFSLGTNNSLLEFLLDGTTPQIKEHLHDSRKDVDRQLKTICELFIKDGTKMLIEPLLKFIDRSQVLLIKQQQSTPSFVSPPSSATTTATAPPINYLLRQQQWASPQQISSTIQESQRLIKTKLPILQRAMQLYLSNKDTEFILFRPIRNNLIGTFVKLEQILTTNGYSNDDLIIASCPTADQISVLLSSASILADQQQGMMNTSAGTQINQRKISSSSIDNESVNPTTVTENNNNTNETSMMTMVDEREN